MDLDEFGLPSQIRGPPISSEREVREGAIHESLPPPPAPVRLEQESLRTDSATVHRDPENLPASPIPVHVDSESHCSDCERSLHESEGDNGETEEDTHETFEDDDKENEEPEIVQETHIYTEDDDKENKDPNAEQDTQIDTEEDEDDDNFQDPDVTICGTASQHPVTTSQQYTHDDDVRSRSINGPITDVRPSNDSRQRARDDHGRFTRTPDRIHVEFAAPRYAPWDEQQGLPLITPSARSQRHGHYNTAGNQRLPLVESQGGVSRVQFSGGPRSGYGDDGGRQYSPSSAAPNFAVLDENGPSDAMASFIPGGQYGLDGAAAPFALEGHHGLGASGGNTNLEPRRYGPYFATPRSALQDVTPPSNQLEATALSQANDPSDEVLAAPLEDWRPPPRPRVWNTNYPHENESVRLSLGSGRTRFTFDSSPSSLQDRRTVIHPFEDRERTRQPSTESETRKRRLTNGEGPIDLTRNDNIGDVEDRGRKRRRMRDDRVVDLTGDNTSPSQARFRPILPRPPFVPLDTSPDRSRFRPILPRPPFPAEAPRQLAPSPHIYSFRGSDTIERSPGPANQSQSQGQAQTVWRAEPINTNPQNSFGQTSISDSQQVRTEADQRVERAYFNALNAYDHLPAWMLHAPSRSEARAHHTDTTSQGVFGPVSTTFQQSPAPFAPRDQGTSPRHQSAPLRRSLDSGRQPPQQPLLLQQPVRQQPSTSSATPRPPAQNNATSTGTFTAAPSLRQRRNLPGIWTVNAQATLRTCESVADNRVGLPGLRSTLELRPIAQEPQQRAPAGTTALPAMEPDSSPVARLPVLRGQDLGAAVRGAGVEPAAPTADPGVLHPERSLPPPQRSASFCGRTSSSPGRPPSGGGQGGGNARAGKAPFGGDGAGDDDDPPPPPCGSDTVNRRGRNIWQLILNQPNILMCLCTEHLTPDEVIQLYSIDKRFYYLATSFLPSLIKGLAKHNADPCPPEILQREKANARLTGSSVTYVQPDLMKIFPSGSYRFLNIRDARRIRIQGTAPHDPSTGERYNVHLSQTIPGFKYLRMLIFRAAKIRHIMKIFLLNHQIALPSDTATALAKAWYMMDIPATATRIGLVHNKQYFTDPDLYHLTLFSVKLDLIINDPLKRPPPHNPSLPPFLNRLPSADYLRRLLWGHRSLSYMADVLSRTQLTHPWQVLTAYGAWHYRMPPLHSGRSVYGVPGDLVGGLEREGWGNRFPGRRMNVWPAGKMGWGVDDQEGSVKPPDWPRLIRPDEAVKKEAIRRGCRYRKSDFRKMVLGGYEGRTCLDEQGMMRRPVLLWPPGWRLPGWARAWEENDDSDEEGEE